MSSSHISVRDALYEQPGPATARMIRIGTALSLIALAVVVFLIVQRFYVTGQLAPRYWNFFLLPTTWAFLLDGFKGTFMISVVSGVLSLVLGLVFMLFRISHVLVLRMFARIYIDFFRGVPSLLLIYFCFLVIPQYGLKLPSFWMMTLPIACAASAVLAEVFRSGVNAVPKGQKEAAQALGFTRMQVMYKVVLPQAIRYVVPALISQLVVVVKDTTVAYVVSYPDLLQNARVLITNYDALVSVYFVVAIIYVGINWMMNNLSLWYARRSSAASRSAVAGVSMEMGEI